MEQEELSEDDIIAASLAASRKIRGFKGEVPVAHLDIDEEDRVERNSDPTVGSGGFWVRVWLYVSQNETDNAKDPTT